ncbi:MAG TPA: VOC family protein [Blastocatellia bacterium]|jgi:uncharacterized glyoxalase superfamily protein PhnB
MSAVKPIPEGFHTITPSIVVSDAASAIEFYKKAFGAEEIMRATTPDGSKVFHSQVRIGDSCFFVYDEFPQMSESEGGSTGGGDCGGARQLSPRSLGATTGALNLYVENADAAFEKAVSAGAQPLMPMEDAFWGDRFGMVADPFGHFWTFSTHMREVSPEEVAAAANEFFSQAGGKA